MRRRSPGALRILIFTSLIATLLSMSVARTSEQACAADPNHAGMVIRFSAEQTSERTWCLGFSQESISGIDALRLSGLPIVTKAFGSDGEYVCKIGDVGTDAADCPARDGSYWGYWRMTPDGWRHSGIGPSTGRVRCGSVEGWAWLEGGTGPAPSPGDFSSICRSAACKESYSPVSPASSANAVDAPAGPAPNSERTGETGSGDRPPGAVSAPAAAPPETKGTAASTQNAPAGALYPDQRRRLGTDGQPQVSAGAAETAGRKQPADSTPEPGRKLAAGPKTSRLIYAILSALIALLATLRIYLWRQQRP